jgi:hypothetical protein
MLKAKLAQVHGSVDKLQREVIDSVQAKGQGMSPAQVGNARYAMDL